MTTWTFLKPTKFEQVASSLSADTGTVDTSVAKHKVDVASKGPLLWAAIGAAGLAVVAVFMKFPTIVMLCGGASGVFFLAWKLADLPSWFWMLGVVAIAAGAALYFGFQRGLFTPVPKPNAPIT